MIRKPLALLSTAPDRVGRFSDEDRDLAAWIARRRRVGATITKQHLFGLMGLWSETFKEMSAAHKDEWRIRFRRNYKVSMRRVGSHALVVVPDDDPLVAH